MARQIGEGLKSDEQRVSCLPTYLSLPNGLTTGRSLVVDTGGTNSRVAAVELSRREGRILKGPKSHEILRSSSSEPVSTQAFFDSQAELAQGFEDFQSIDALGYCFSYPARNTDDGDAVLLRWTKGLEVKDVVGHKVGAILMDSLKTLGWKFQRLAVLNDTVASLLGGVHLNSNSRFGRNYIGLILGTGTNMAGVFSPVQLTKIPNSKFESHSMIVNLESGNMDPGVLNDYDEIVDRNSSNPGAQLLEKAVSGYYLPFIFDAVSPGMLRPEDGSAELVKLRKLGGAHGKLAGDLLRRSAQLAAAGLAAVASFYPKGDTAVLAEGSLLWGDPLYADTLRETLLEIAPDRNIELVHQRENINLLGAAVACLSR